MNTKRFTLIFAAILLLLAVAMTAVACDNGNVETPTTEQSTEAPTAAPTETETETEAPEETTDDGKVTYTVTVVDANGAPVAGVAVQFCDDNGCRMPVATNAEGIVTLTDVESNFHVTIASVPEGYAEDTAEYYFEDGYELTITLVAG